MGYGAAALPADQLVALAACAAAACRGACYLVAACAVAPRGDALPWYAGGKAALSRGCRAVFLAAFKSAGAAATAALSRWGSLLFAVACLAAGVLLIEAEPQLLRALDAAYVQSYHPIILPLLRALNAARLLASALIPLWNAASQFLSQALAELLAAALSAPGDALIRAARGVAAAFGALAGALTSWAGGGSDDAPLDLQPVIAAARGTLQAAAVIFGGACPGNIAAPALALLYSNATDACISDALNALLATAQVPFTAILRAASGKPSSRPNVDYAANQVGGLHPPCPPSRFGGGGGLLLS